MTLIELVFTSYLTQNRSFETWSSQPISWLSTKEPNLTQ